MCEQVLTKFATNKTLQSIIDYNTMSFVARHQDVSYAVDGEITYSAMPTSAAVQYDFPFTRHVDPLSIIEQCHSILRARTFTHPATLATEPVVTSTSTTDGETGPTITTNNSTRNTRRRLITLEAIMHYVQAGIEWKPLNIHTNSSDKAHMSRKEIVRVINEYATHMPLNILHDSRFVSYDSHFCQNDAPEPLPRPQKLNLRKHNAVLNSLKAHVENTLNSPANNNDLHLASFGMTARTVGNNEVVCPCAQRHSITATDCTISFAICQIAKLETGSQKIFFESVMSGCTAEGRSDNTDIVYRGEHKDYVRTLLKKYNHILKDGGFVCSTMRPSDLWGIGVSHYKNAEYLNTSYRGDLQIDVARLLLHPKSGVSMLNYEYVTRNIHTVLSDGDREVLLAVDDATQDTTTRARNVLCEQDELSEKNIAQFGFPVLSMLTESPAVLNCVRYALEVSWKDILDEFVPLEINSVDATVGMHADADVAIDVWRDRCSAKLHKLSTCFGQAAYSAEFVGSIVERGVEKYRTTCPFTLAPELTALASIMYGPCLLTIHRDDKVDRLCDPHLCITRGTPERLQQIRDSGNGASTVLRKEDIGIGRDGAYSNKCEIFHPLSMLSIVDKDDNGVADMPLLSEKFVQSLIAPRRASNTLTPDVGNHQGVRESGILGTRVGVDFLFPSQRNGQLNGPDNNASSQCFEAFSYWPQHWQAPFGEILHDTHEHVTAFGNYMALLTADSDCADEISCQDKLVLLPDHLRFENMSSNYFGTSGVCREPSFGMPMVPTNTHGVCTSNPTTSSTPNEQDTSDSFVCESQNTEACACSESPRVSLGGGMGDTIGHLWPLLRAFFLTNQGEYEINMTAVNDMSIQTLSEFVNLDMNIDLQEDDSDVLSHIVREQCYGADAYGNVQYDDPLTECVHNDECADDGKVCGVKGQCIEIQIDIENQLLNSNVEIGLNSPSCVHNQDSFSGASPWRRMQDILEQHGMCSHANRVAYERMNDLFQQLPTSQTGCTEHRDAATDLDYWTCDRSMVNWTWVRERPDFIPFPDDVDPTERHYDMRAAHVSYSILHDGLFDIAPHLCDSEYMHSHSMGWCGLEHHQTTTTAPATPLTPSLPVLTSVSETAKWMRTAPRHSQFSMLKPVQADVDRRTSRTTIPARDKLRFMGLEANMLKYTAPDATATTVTRQNLAVQQCADLGVCQTEIFTAAGTHHTRRKPNPSVPSPAGQPSVTVKVSDMTFCGPMGYKQNTLSGVKCVLDRAVAPIVYLLRDRALASNSAPIDDNACLNLYGRRWNAGAGMLILNGNANGADNDITYEGGKAAIKLSLQTFLNSLIVMNQLPITVDRVKTGDNIYACTIDLVTYIEAQPHFYTKPQRVPGLYVMLEFGTYEIPLFWWLKYTLARTVFQCADALQVTTTRLCSPRILQIDAFQNRIAPSNVVPEGILTDGTTLREFWSRANVQELGLWTKSHDFVVAELARHIDATMQVSAVMGCVTEFSVDASKIQALRTAARENEYQQMINRRLETTLDSVFTKRENVILWGGLDGDEPSNVSSKGLSSAFQFSDTGLLADRNGLDSVLTFADDKFDTLADDKGFMRTFLKRIFDNLIDVNKYNPLMNPDDQVETITHPDGMRKGIKILDLNFAMILDAMTGSNQIQDFTTEFLGTYDKIFEDDRKMQSPSASANAAPVFTTGCQNQAECEGIIRTHCIFDKHSRMALLQQGRSSGWDSTPAFVALYSSDSSRFRQIDMCMPSEDETLFGFSDPFTGTASMPETVYSGGRCSLADLSEDAYGPGYDLPPATVFGRNSGKNEIENPVRHNLPPWKLMSSGDVSLDDSRCGIAEDEGPPKLSDEPMVDNTDDNQARFVGDLYMTHSNQRSNTKLCHRIDSRCVTPTRTDSLKIFPDNHPAQMRYDRLDRNAHTQVNGRMWEKTPPSRPTRLTAENLYNDMFTQNLEISQVFATSTSDLWTPRTEGTPNNECRVSKISWPVGLNVVPFVLNSAELGNDVSFSHVIYNDRVLMRRIYDDGTEQQLYGHHFQGGKGDSNTRQQITSPTPLMSHCGESFGNMHKFKKVDMEPIGKVRMYERFHRFNQDIDFDSNFEYKRTKKDYLSDWSGAFLGGQNNAVSTLKNYYFFWKDDKSPAQSMLGLGLFFNSRFRWTTPTTAAVAPNPTFVPHIVSTCVYVPIDRRFALEELTGSCKRVEQCLGVIDNCSPGNWQDAPVATQQTNVWRNYFSNPSLPIGETPWDAFTLAAYYEQDAYEESTIRPWWSSTACDMVQNFADRTTNYYFLDLLFDTMPTQMFDMIGNLFDSNKRLPNVQRFDENFEKVADTLSLGNLFGKDKFFRAKEGLEYDSYAWRTKMRFISDPKSTYKHLMDYKLDKNFADFANNNDLSGTNAFTQLLGQNLLLSTRFARVLGQSSKPTPLSFAACSYGIAAFDSSGLTYHAAKHCDVMHATTKRRITKPSLWAEVDGSPGKQLLACAPGETQGCFPILTQGKGITRGLQDPLTKTWSDNVWQKEPQTSGACSYSVEFDSEFFCDPLILPTQTLVERCDFTNVASDQHPKPVRGGKNEKPNILWQCQTCNKFSDTQPILTNPKSSTNTLLHQHRVGCGIYRRDRSAINKTFTGPMTSTHKNYASLMRDVVAALGGIFSNVEDIESTLSAGLLSLFGDKLFIHDNAIWWNVASGNNTAIHPQIVSQFSKFGLGESMGYPLEGCPLGSHHNIKDVNSGIPMDCTFPVYDANAAFENSILFRNDLDNGCMATDNGQDHLSKDSCNGNITKSTVDRIKMFTERIHRATFGLSLPIVAVGETISTRVTPGSRVSWIEGVLPFYAASERVNEHLHDGDYLEFVLDNKARCQDSYKGKSLSQYACYLDTAGVVQLVTPWLGKNYSFLKVQNRLKILEYQYEATGMETPQQEMFRVEMGTDLCLAADRMTPLPCTATACIDEEYKTFQNETSFCKASRPANRFYEEEVPKKTDRLYVERLHLSQNLYNPDASYSQCYIKYTPHDQEKANGKKCTHMQAPIGYSPSVVRAAVKGVTSLNRSKVSIAAARIVRHEFSASPTPLGYPSLWTGAQLALDNTAEAVYFSLCSNLA